MSFPSERRRLFTLITGIVGISRPVWAFFLVYCYFVFIFMVIEGEAIFSVILGFISMFFFYLGHFSLNAIFDKEIDRDNPRKNSLNSWNDDLGVTAPSVWLLISIFWVLSLMCSFLHTFLYERFLPVYIVLAIILAILYSVPPIQLKGNAPWDLIINSVSFGILGPIFAIESVSPGLIITPIGLFFILLFSSATLMIVVLPTILMDSEVDEKYGLKTFSVRYGAKNTSRMIEISYIMQIIPSVFFVWEFLVLEYYLGILIIVIFLVSERIILSPLFYSQTLFEPPIAIYRESQTFLTQSQISFRKAEAVAENLTFCFLIGGTGLLIFLIVSRMIDFDANLLIKTTISPLIDGFPKLFGKLSFISSLIIAF